MKVVLCNRPDWREISGGDVVQMLRTKDALERDHGIETSIASSPEDSNLADADLVHIFNVQNPAIGLSYVRAAQSLGKPIALSPIFWDLSHAAFVANLARKGHFRLGTVWKRRKGAFDRLARITGALMGRPAYYAPGYRSAVRDIVEASGVVLPNSDEEAEQLVEFTGVRSQRTRVVVNAIDFETFPPAEGDRSGVIMAARIEPAKNTMGLVLAMEGHSESLTLVGRPVDLPYAEAVRRQAKPSQVTIVDSNVDQAELASMYRRARVHVLPSFRESPGLTTLEALSSGCAAVVSERQYCPVDTYFSDLLGRSVFVCDPYEPDSIRAAIDQALEATNLPDLRGWRARFSWSQAASTTFEAYRTLTSA